MEQTTGQQKLTTGQAVGAINESQLVAHLHKGYALLKQQIHEVIVGQSKVVDAVLCCMLAGGHCIVQGVPGLAKTLMVHSISDAMKLKFNRIQFTPDLMPSDITGGDVLNGAIVAIAGNSLSHWCELRRKASDADAARADPAPFPPVDDKPQSGGGNDVGPVNDRADRASASADGSPMCRVFGDSLWRMER